MKYLDGQLAMIGDRVDLGGGMTGTVVCCFDDGQCIPGFSIEKWIQLREGVLVKSPEAGLIHFAEPNIDLVLLQRAQP